MKPASDTCVLCETYSKDGLAHSECIRIARRVCIDPVEAQGK
jgi:hypothetical protein